MHNIAFAKWSVFFLQVPPENVYLNEHLAIAYHFT
jgi:hypothetical protein